MCSFLEKKNWKYICQHYDIIWIKMLRNHHPNSKRLHKESELRLLGLRKLTCIFVLIWQPSLDYFWKSRKHDLAFWWTFWLRAWNFIFRDYCNLCALVEIGCLASWDKCPYSGISIEQFGAHYNGKTPFASEQSKRRWISSPKSLSNHR